MTEDRDDISQQGMIHGQGHILVVDDEDIICEVTADALEMLGYEVSVCKDGTTAVEFFRDSQDKVDLVILDLVMPDMNGWTVCRKIKEINPNVKVLLTSGFTKDTIPEKALHEAVDGFLEKPVQIIELSRIVAQTLGIQGKSAKDGKR